MAHQTLQGRLLVATPALLDPNFAHTVVLVLEHGDEGALGLVLNRPSETEVSEALPDWESVAGEPPLVFVGGPVQQNAIVGLAPAGSAAAGVEPVVAGVGIVDLEQDPVVLAAELDRVRLYAGYAGWGEGQLEAEIDAGSWFVVECDEADVFTAEPDRLWRGVLSRQGGVLRTIPEDPSLN